VRARILDGNRTVNAVPFPTNTRVIRSLTRALPSWLMAMVSLKSEMRQLRTWATAVLGRNPSSSTRKTFTTEDTEVHGGNPRLSRWRSILEFHRDRRTVPGLGLKELLLLESKHPARMLVGNDWILVFRSRTTAL